MPRPLTAHTSLLCISMLCVLGGAIASSLAASNGTDLIVEHLAGGPAPGAEAQCSLHTTRATVRGACVRLPDQCNGHLDGKHDLTRLYTALPPSVIVPTHCFVALPCLSWALIAVMCGIAVLRQMCGLVRARRRLRVKEQQVRREYNAQLLVLTSDSREELELSKSELGERERELDESKTTGAKAAKDVEILRTALQKSESKNTALELQISDGEMLQKADDGAIEQV